MKQLRNESPLTVNAILQTHLKKMIAAFNKQGLTVKEKQAKMYLIDTKTKIGQILHTSNPKDIVFIVSRIKRELQL